MGSPGWTRVRHIYRGAALLWLNFCVFFAVLNLVAAVAIALRPGRAGDVLGWIENPPKFILNGFAASFPEWSEQERIRLWRSNAYEFTRDPLVLYRERPVSGEYVTIDPNGFRAGREQAPWPPAEDGFNVFLLGGSTAFGYGVPDEETLSSHLQQLLPSVGGREPRLYNFARGGFYSTAERLLFEKLLSVGPAPDLAIFVDGVNDFADVVSPILFFGALTEITEQEVAHPLLPAIRALPLAHLLQPPPVNIALERQVGARRKGAGGRQREAISDEERIDTAIDRYLSNRTAIEAIAEIHGVAVLFVWQPAPTYRYDLSYHPYKGKSFGGHELSRRGYPRMRARVDASPLGEDFLWCADIQEGVSEPLYLDQMHYSPGMSLRLARCIADGLVERELLR